MSFFEYLVFSAAHKWTLARVIKPLLEISSKFPIGVATIYKAPNLVFLGIVSYFYKFLIISANLILFLGCSTNIPNNTFDSNKVIAIEKPEIFYDSTKTS